ncbi:uncharacterized protein LOC116021558 isoform X2 [Ipomoea triloba]|uniref:uncharacterized protein LOC116021558 isoform X2 n=1 Tax=Ipomoea triloba TaxID=35885 RepID=UPI00125E3A1E|nr:uncharacterized protein LOC116021558 isoform X2 [Ipomoea triloba]
MAPSVIPDLSKITALDGNNYKRWTQRILILFEQLELVYVLFCDPLEPAQLRSPFQEPREISPEPDYTHDQELGITLVQFTCDNMVARGYLLSQMNDKLFDIYVKQDSARVIWKMLSEKYGANDAGNQSVRNNNNKKSGKVKKLKGGCFVCDNHGHRTYQCYHRKGKIHRGLL